MVPEKDFAGRQSTGTRSVQEDAYAFSEIPDEDGMLVIVADGMGGHAAGELASGLALEAFVAAFHETKGPPGVRLRKALDSANEAIAGELQREPACEGMGTTLVAACVTSAGVEWVSVGDSPLYLWRDKKLSRLNEDHSLRPVISEMAKEGKVSAKDPARNILRAALIGDEIAMIDQSPRPLPLREGDLLLAASDGIQTISDDQIGRLFADGGRQSAADIATRVINAVNGANNPKQDNTTVAILRSTFPDS